MFCSFPAVSRGQTNRGIHITYVVAAIQKCFGKRHKKGVRMHSAFRWLNRNFTGVVSHICY